MNSIVIDYSESKYKKFAPKTEVVSFLNQVLECEKLDRVQFSVSFINEDRMHSLNLQYRGIDDSTDILSFAVRDGNDEFAFVSGKSRYENIGDILICPEVCERNANIFNITPDEELHRLLVHGVLHLNGMNHLSNDATEPMLVHQEDIMNKLFISPKGGIK